MDSEGKEFLAAQISELPVFREFTSFFDRTRSGKASPVLRDFDLMSEYRLARNMYIFDIHEGTPTFWIRYTGMHICDFFGFDSTGRFLENLNFEENFDETIAGYHTVVREKSPYAFLNYIAFHEARLNEYKKGQQFVMIRLSFPLLDSNGDVVNIVGAMDFLDIGAAPKERFVQLPFADIPRDR